ncbi:thioredoxin family protein [Salinirubellus sp. GCM10025818]|jgi:peroxiredoxin|uniref:thioredoxin family protein n=1 Tax=Salinirubellus TaxID=2162630 RepID=UPI0030CE8397
MALESEADALARGDTAPPFELRGADGETYTLDSFAEGEALLVVFTCNHCPYAKARIPAMNGIAADYDEVAVVGINPNDEEQYPEDSFERMQEYVESGDVQYDAYLRDDTQEVARAYGAVCTPDPFLFANHEGREARSASDGASSAERSSADHSSGQSPREDGDEPRAEFHLKYHGRLDDATNPDDEPSGEPGFEMREVIDAVLAGEEVDRESRPSRGCSIKWRED